jgi:hypothetical protein
LRYGCGVDFSAIKEWISWIGLRVEDQGKIRSSQQDGFAPLLPDQRVSSPDEHFSLLLRGDTRTRHGDVSVVNLKKI